MDGRDKPGHDAGNVSEAPLHATLSLQPPPDAVNDDWLAGELVWRSSLMQTDVVKANWLVVNHIFNHQTHHRGQIHAMLTAAGAKPQDTDLILMESRAT